ncbi:MAG: hypothetical protein IJ874_04020 [Ruminococcus sp.]|nr:hypothetical protein [Ruminococcus sp.]
MTEIPAWLKFIRTVTIVIFVFILTGLGLILFWGLGGPVNSGSELFDELFGIVLAMGVVIFVGDVLTSPVFLAFVGFFLLSNVLYLYLKSSIKKHGSADMTPKKAGVIIGAGTIIFLAIGIISSWGSLLAMPGTFRGKRLIRQADEIHSLSESHRSWGGIYDMEDVVFPSVLIDYDSHRVSFVYSDHDENYNWSDHYWSVKLKRTGADDELYRHITEDYYIEAVVELVSPGKRLVSCYDDSEHRFSQAMLLEMADGTFYCLDRVPEAAKGDYSQEYSLFWSDYRYQEAEQAVWDAYIEKQMEEYYEEAGEEAYRPDI